MKKPIIGVVGNILTMENGIMIGLERAYVNNDYVRAVEKAGGVPVVLPVIDDDEAIISQVKACDGIIISGGQDVHPMSYNEEPHEKLGYVNSKIDEYQIKLVKTALQEKKPLLGICRGHQILNVACGGTLYQDLSEMSGSILKHFQEGKRYDYSHKIKIKSDSILDRLFGKEVLINSYHHQCINQVGEGLEVVANASDGVIEAVQMKESDFVMGVQWHPEMMVAGSDTMLILFKELIENCE
ncbi:gamma-glutamyl-gamma-aminobutyrate hydrolase family protein [Oceanirhabdus seepicola]|uniref:Gamma-glutamyl-gamma-aminobutyrate hydrolase family protein n=1 Tax=Oceanirhabdus seepicola TaxID=2828781 RepID=A0A9J6P397_9CLOT|nr:gamma-glutamyl-gamma-aminobutyrate hydrolase family protein [Oceanirhabdus seepicola]MCM1989968.1 gamma-glutamyl-gamma-aminobutyrate hydrolase family protein [Oceanirhabdus seepicola]